MPISFQEHITQYDFWESYVEVLTVFCGSWHFAELNLAHSSWSCPENLCNIDFKYNWMAQELLDQFLDTILDF